jgi:hypothetical protein
MIFWIDNTEVNPPINWFEIEPTLRRDEAIGGVLLLVEGSFTFDNDGYQYLLAKVNEGFCGKVKIDIFDTTSEGVPTQAFSGFSFVSDWVIDELKNQITIKIQDNSFYAKINNNKSLKPYLRGTRTKNGETLAKAGNYFSIFDDVNTGITIARYIYGHRVYDAFKFLIGYMTDNSVIFASDTFGVGGDWAGLMITTGRKIREYLPLTPDGPQLTPFSFSELFDEINKRIPIGFVIEDPFNNPVIRIEAKDYFYKGTSAVEFSDINQIKTRFDQEKLYSKIKFGQGAINSDALTVAFPELVLFLGFNTEEYPMQYECNIDKVLDLKTDWITSSNVIQNVAENLDNGNDEDLFLIETTYVTASLGNAIQLNTFGDTPPFYFYNQNLRNESIAERLLGAVPSNIVSVLGDVGDGTFKAFLGTDQSYLSSGNDVFNPSGFPNEIFDISGSYNNSTYKFTASNYGRFSFEANVRIEVTALSSLPIVYWQIQLSRYDSTGTFIRDYDIFTPNFISSLNIGYYSFATLGTTDIGGKRTITLNTGDTVQIKITKNVFVSGDIDYTIRAVNTYFGCYDNTIGGGTYQTYDPNDYPIFIHEFQYPLTKGQWEYILANPLNSYKFYSGPSNVRYGWVSEIKRNQQSGMATVKLISDKNSQANGGAK